MKKERMRSGGEGNILHNLKQWIHLSFSSFGLGRISFIALTALFITLRMCCGTWLLTCNILIIFCWNEKKLKKRFVHFDELHSKIRVSKRIRTSHHYMIGTPRSSRTTLHWKWMTSDLLLCCLSEIVESRETQWKYQYDEDNFHFKTKKHQCKCSLISKGGGTHSH